MSKAQNVDDLKSGNLKLEAATLDDAKVQVYGDAPVVTYGRMDARCYPRQFGEVTAAGDRAAAISC